MPYRDVIAAIPHVTRYLVWKVSTPPSCCDTPPPFWHLASRRHICAIPHLAIYRAIIAPHPIKRSTKEFVILSLQASRDMKTRNQEKGVLAKGGSAELNVMPNETKNYPTMLGPAVHWALRAPQPREAYIFAQTVF